MLMESIFMAIEGFAFLLPAFPPMFAMRIGILGIYLAAHYFGLNKVYSRIKTQYKHIPLETFVSSWTGMADGPGVFSDNAKPILPTYV